MIRKVEPVENSPDFEKLSNAFQNFMSDPESFKFLSFSLKKFEVGAVDEITRKNKTLGLEYYVYEDYDIIESIMAVKKDVMAGFELFMLMVSREKHNKGIGQTMIAKCLDIAARDGYRCVTTYVFADNKKMLRLIIKNDFVPVHVFNHSRADGVGLVQLRYYFKTK
jgi:RimJ/RimL family protein N-acetyltransferase